MATTLSLHLSRASGRVSLRSVACPLLHRRHLASAASPSGQPKTFSNQSQIPRLPIPSLTATAERYKRTLLPALTTDEYASAATAVDEFVKEGGLGEVLQERLKQLDREEPNSWLETLWLNKAYLEYREPTLINVNWWTQFRDPDVGLLKQAPAPGHVSDFQLERAAGFVSGLLTFNHKINNELIPPESTRAGPLCMHQYKNQFGAYRLPEEPRDRIVVTWPATASHITVLFRDQLFRVQVLGATGERVPVKAIEGQLRQIVTDVNALPNLALQPPVGILTSEHRDTWARFRASLARDPGNVRSLEAIDTSLFVLCLDDYASADDMDIAHRNLFHGRNARNRWFDKSMQFIVESNGRGGVNGEHSPADAVIPCKIFDEFLTSEPAQDPAGANASITLPPPEHLHWTVDAATAEAIVVAEERARKVIENVDSVILHYGVFGSEFIKKVKVSPDSFMQMVYQLAYYRQHGRPTPTYESASSRAFKHGRTETVRSCSVESVRFTEAWEDKNVSPAQKLELFDKAVASHGEYMKAASTGQGVDRHLLGLRFQLRTDAERAQAGIFNDPSYWSSQHWRLSTSNTSPGDNHWGGFGAVYEDGYGVNYAIGKKRVRMSVSSYKNVKETDSAAFRKTIEGVMEELADVLEKRWK
ncbi:acyltransferase ChoActase/COT/CPT [Jimgerdemannia flammicorona]|uniref:Acyltransferase ChoActase/COT/CPT n=1 Tax=Jimgerdemannia flammicorona TaxID=994334 RepID=A0A433QGE9_9FUNG|nr:acyltransferase ChoActase/COT/CPT [Jimgerdemannia flammicorona]